MSKLRFTVVACSGEDAAFPARELNEHASSSKGYMTPKNCEYPQELVLRLADGLCRVTQVQLLSHQTHIATKIELFLAKSSSLQDAAYQRLGYLTLKSNVESNYMARELKTVHIDNEATFVKLVLHQCYVNERNMYSQVGIMAVNLCGEPLEGSPVLGGELPNQSTGEPLNGGNRSVAKPVPSATDDLAFDLRFDAKTTERIREIQIAKDKAVASEDYDQAKRLKKLEEHLKSIGLQLARLEAQKREAVANEDYDLAKRIKDEIAMLEATASSSDTQPIIPSGSSSSPTYPNGASSGGARSTSRSQVLPRAGAAAIMGTKGVGNSPVGVGGSSSFSPRDMYPSDERARSKKNNSANFSEDSPVQSNSRRQQPSKMHAEAHEDNEDSEDPARGSGDTNVNFRGIPDAENLPDPEDLPAALEKENEELISVIGLFLVKCFYSNLWNHRDVAIRKVTMDLDKYPQDPLYVVRVCSVLVQSGAGDRIAQVSLSAFRLLERMLTFGAKIRRDEMCGILANTMTQLVNKLGEPQAKVRDEASSILSRLASAKNVGVASVMSQLTKRSKKPLGIKFLHGRLLTIKDLVEKFELLDGTDHSLEGVMSFLEDTNSFGHQAKEVREVAKEITVSLFLLVGPDVEGYLKSLRPKQLEEYQIAFEEAETARAANSRTKAPPKENPRGAASGPAGRQGGDNRSQPRGPPPQSDVGGDDDDDDESVDEYTCPFCGIVDENFDSDRLDQHFWAECRMLTPCKMCGQVIEISGLNEHLLVECELKKNHKECPRCGEAITVKFFDKHVSLNDCPPRPNPKKANRCPLCHEDAPPGKKGWKVHLLEETCPNNPRGQ